MDTTQDRSLQRATWLARALDDWYLDPIMGFVLPGLGDIIAALLGLYIVFVAVQRKVSRVVVARMLVNLAIDAVVGAVPIVGDAYDVVFKANRRNLELLHERAPATPARATDWLFIAGAATAFAASLLAPLMLFIWLIKVLIEHMG